MTKSPKAKTAKAALKPARTAPARTNVTKSKSAKPKPTKKSLLVKRLKTRKGATQQQLSDEFGWQAHTVRAAISRLRTAGFEVTQGEGKDASTYRIAA